MNKNYLFWMFFFFFGITLTSCRPCVLIKVNKRVQTTKLNNRRWKNQYWLLKNSHTQQTISFCKYCCNAQNVIWYGSGFSDLYLFVFLSLFIYSFILFYCVYLFIVHCRSFVNIVNKVNIKEVCLLCRIYITAKVYSAFT